MPHDPSALHSSAERHQLISNLALLDPESLSYVMRFANRVARVLDSSSCKGSRKQYIGDSLTCLCELWPAHQVALQSLASEYDTCTVLPLFLN